MVKTIYVGNLVYSATKESVQELLTNGIIAREK